jgi:hypothetical protein
MVIVIILAILVIFGQGLLILDQSLTIGDLKIERDIWKEQCEYLEKHGDDDEVDWESVSG